MEPHFSVAHPLTRHGLAPRFALVAPKANKLRRAQLRHNVASGRFARFKGVEHLHQLCVARQQSSNGSFVLAHIVLQRSPRGALVHNNRNEAQRGVLKLVAHAFFDVLEEQAFFHKGADCGLVLMPASLAGGSFSCLALSCELLAQLLDGCRVAFCLVLDLIAHRC
ncbi:MAG: hypothetical protein Q8J97_11160, partial [Flavobacteriaceae bacterium]|nr:hypothetical protein [Flavobacteriaceae bacterium]